MELLWSVSGAGAPPIEATGATHDDLAPVVQHGFPHAWFAYFFVGSLSPAAATYSASALVEGLGGNVSPDVCYSRTVEAGGDA